MDAVSQTWRFHATVYEAMAMPELFALVQSLWLRTFALLAQPYPHAPPTYLGRHRHLDVIEALTAGDGAAVRAAIQADTVEGGARLLALLGELDAGRVSVGELLAGEVGLGQLLGVG